MSRLPFLCCILLVAVSLCSLSIAQTEGWLGKRGYIKWEGHTFPSIRHEPLPSARWNLRNQLGVNYVLTRHVVVGAHLGGLGTTQPVHVFTDSVSLVINRTNSKAEDFLRIAAWYVGARVQVFLPKPAGSLAPLGLYGALSVNRLFAQVYEPQSSSGRISYVLADNQMGNLQAWAVQLQVGNQMAVSPRFLIDIGLQTGVVFGGQFQVAHPQVSANVGNWAQQRLFHHNGFNIVVGAGWLF